MNGFELKTSGVGSNHSDHCTPFESLYIFAILNCMTSLVVEPWHYDVTQWQCHSKVFLWFSGSLTLQLLPELKLLFFHFFLHLEAISRKLFCLILRLDFSIFSIFLHSKAIFHRSSDRVQLSRSKRSPLNWWCKDLIGTLSDSFSKEWRIENIPGCRYSSVDSSAPTILPPGFESQAHHQSFFHL